MNATEKRYLKERLNEIFWDKRRSLEKDMRARSVEITDQERLNLVRENKVKLKSKRALKDMITHDLGYIKNVFDFSYYENPFDPGEFKERVNELEEKKIATMDQIMIGGSEEALKLLKEFENLKA